MLKISRSEAIEELAKPGGRLRYNLCNGEDANGGFMVLDPDEYEGAPNCYVADVREGWAAGIMEAICDAESFYLFDSFLNGAAVWIDGCETPAEHVSTR